MVDFSMQNMAGSLSHLDVGQLNASNISAGTITARTVNTSSSNSQGLWSYTTISAFSPTSFSTMSNGTTLTLLNKPDLAQATSVTDESVVKIPANAEIISVFIDNGGTNITTSASGSYQIGIADVADGVNNHVNTLGNVSLHFTETVLNTVGGLALGHISGGALTGTGALLGGSGISVNANFGAAVSSSSETTLSFRNLAAGNFSTGKLRVELTYRQARSFA